MEWNGTGTICGNYISFIRLLFQDITDLGEIRCKWLRIMMDRLMEKEEMHDMDLDKIIGYYEYIPGSWEISA